MTTKERIIEEALTQFSLRGYTAVSVRDIAYAIGIKESSLYNHFKNKQDILDTIVEICKKRTESHYSSLNLQDTFRGDLSVYVNLPPEMLHQISRSLFSFYVTDPYIRDFRRLLTIEQFNNPVLSALYKDMYIDQAIHFQTELFRYLMAVQAIKPGNPEATALEFYAPIFLLLCRFETLEGEAERLLRLHIDEFLQKNGK